MHTDELRAELAELAREVDAFPEELPAIRRRVARRRLAQASVATVLVVGLLVGVIATRSGGDHVRVAGHPKETSIEDVPRIDALVWLPTSGDVTAVRGILDATDLVRRFASLPSDADAVLHLRFKPGYAAIFGVELDGSMVAVHRLTARLGSAAIVKKFGVPEGTPIEEDVRIFMNPAACEAQIDAVRDAVAGDSDVVSFRFVDKSDALEEFRKLFHDQPTLVENTKAKTLPTSFRLRVREEAVPAAVADRYTNFAGVREVNVPVNPFANDTIGHGQTKRQPACAPTP